MTPAREGLALVAAFKAGLGALRIDAHRPWPRRRRRRRRRPVHRLIRSRAPRRVIDGLCPSMVETDLTTAHCGTFPFRGQPIMAKTSVGRVRAAAWAAARWAPPLLTRLSTLLSAQDAKSADHREAADAGAGREKAR